MLEAAGDMLRLSVGVIFHPVDTFENIKKNRHFFSYIPVFVLLLATVVIQVATIFCTHYPLSSISPDDASVFNECVRFVVPVVGWAISCYIMTSIMDGECLFKEVLTASVYSMMPFILFMLPVSLVSNVFSLGELGIYQFLTGAVWAWVLLLFFVSVKVLNDYTVRKTLVVCFLSILAMIVIVAVLLLVYAMVNQLVQIIRDVYTEIRMLNW